MDDNKALLNRAPEIVAALKRACHDCTPTPCCEYEVLGVDAAALIEAQAEEIRRLKFMADSAKNVAIKGRASGDGSKVQNE